MKVYAVMHNMGIDGSYIVTAFSKQEDAEKLCELYEQTYDYRDYDFYSVSELEVDEHNINDYSVQDKELVYKGE